MEAAAKKRKKGGCGSRQKKQLVQITLPTQKTKAPKGPGIPVEDVHCSKCGRTEQKQNTKYWHHRCSGEQIVEYQTHRQQICEQNICGQNDNGVCKLILNPDRDRPGIIEVGIKMPEVACPLNLWSRVARRCPKCNAFLFDGRQEPRRCHYCDWSAFKPADGKVCFLGPVYQPFGGTETWHRTLLPRLSGVTGYGVLNPDLSTGDPSTLGVPLAIGHGECRELVIASETVVVWGLGEQLSGVLAGVGPKRVISVSHCDARSSWTVDIMKQQARYSSAAVYIEPSGWDTIPESLVPKATLIPNGVLPQQHKPNRSRDDVRQSLGISRDDKMLLMVCRISPEKQIEVVAKAVQQLPGSYHLVVVGNVQSEFHDYLAGFKWMNRVHVVPGTNTPGDYYNAADAFVSASQYEGCGLSMVEAALANLPLLATPVGIVETNNEVAQVVPLNASPYQWAEAIKRDFELPGLQRQRTQRAKAILSKRHDVGLFTQRWARLLGVKVAKQKTA